MGFPTTDLLYSTDRVLKTIKKIHIFKNQPATSRASTKILQEHSRTHIHGTRRIAFAQI